MLKVLGVHIGHDARQTENKDIVNRTVKFRESFRPFCPCMKVESAEKYLENPERIERDTYPAFWNLLNEYEKLTGTAVLMNTSFNVKGEPIVCNPRDAIKCFFDTGVQVLALGTYILKK